MMNFVLKNEDITYSLSEILMIKESRNLIEWEAELVTPNQKY